MKEAAYKSFFSLCVDAAFERCSFEVNKMIWSVIRNIFIVCCNYMEGIYSPAEGHVEAEKGHTIKTRYGVVVVVSIFLSVYLLT